MRHPQRKIISDKLTLEKCGKTLQECYVLLDERGARKLDHRGIFALVSAAPEFEGLGAWNQNLLVTSYEWQRGLRERGQREDGFEISVSKTIEAPAEFLYVFFSDQSKRNKWLEAPVTITKATAFKSLRATWQPDGTRLSVELYNKGPAKTQVVVQHQKISSAKEAGQKKTFWKKKLTELAALWKAR